jgi:cell division transport system permease protein
MLLQLKRTFKASLTNFNQNIWLAVATISVIAVALFIINIQIANIVANNLLLRDVEEKINISVYLNQNIDDKIGHQIEQQIKSLPEVKSISYISKNDALKKFNKDNANNKVLQEAMAEFEGENPLGIILNISAFNPRDYKKITEKIKQLNFKNKIESISYEEYKGIIDNLTQEIESSQKVALILGITLSLVAILVTFNTIRITIYTHHKEIEIMKLVGGSNFYVVSPFIWEGIIYGSVGALVAIFASYGYLYFITMDTASNTLLSLSNAKFIKQFLGEYFIDNIFLAIGLQFILGIFLGVISSLVSVRKYLKI